MHTPCPDGYLPWHAWAEEKSKTHAQVRCDGCGLFAIWLPIAEAEAAAEAALRPEDTVAATFYRAVCAECGAAGDGDGEEYQPTRVTAVAIALADLRFARSSLGRLLCEDCRDEGDGPGDGDYSTHPAGTELVAAVGQKGEPDAAR